MTISATTQGLRMGVATSSSRPTVPFDGQVISETDTDSLKVYKGTAWAPVSGLTLISATTVGTTVSSVTVTSVFSTTYDSYKIIWTGGVMSTATAMQMYMGSATGSSYNGARTATNVSAAAALAGDNNVSQWGFAGAGSTTYAIFSAELHNPFTAKYTILDSLYMETTVALGRYAGHLANTTSYTSFTLDPESTATMTGGTVYVYGIAKA